MLRPIGMSEMELLVQFDPIVVVKWAFIIDIQSFIDHLRNTDIRQVEHPWGRFKSGFTHPDGY